MAVIYNYPKERKYQCMCVLVNNQSGAHKVIGTLRDASKYKKIKAIDSLVEIFEHISGYLITCVSVDRQYGLKFRYRLSVLAQIFCYG